MMRRALLAALLVVFALHAASDDSQLIHQDRIVETARQLVMERYPEVAPTEVTMAQPSFMIFCQVSQYCAAFLDFHAGDIGIVQVQVASDGSASLGNDSKRVHYHGGQSEEPK